MEISICRAERKEIPAIQKLLSEVLELHAKLRPDLFISGKTKYTAEELEPMLENEQTPVFVAHNEQKEVVGYAFCQLKNPPFSTNMKPVKSLFIDDLCVDTNCRGAHVGSKLFAFVKEYAKAQGCYDVTLNVWEGNDNARAFYEKMGMFVKETQMEILL